MTFEDTLFRDLIKAIWTVKGAAVGDYGTSQDLQMLYDRVSTLYRPLSNDRELDVLLPADRTACDFMRQNAFIYLDPPEKSRGLPILSVKYDFSRTHPVVRLKLGLFFWSAAPSVATREIASIGFRYETPEPPNADGIGTHNFYHVQLIRGFEKGDIEEEVALLGAPSWLPVVQPALPLYCDDPIDLALCCMHSLYGLGSLASINQHCRNRLSERLGRMSERGLKAPSFWLLKTPSGVQYVRTFDRDAVERYRAGFGKRATKHEINKASFFAAREEQRHDCPS